MPHFIIGGLTVTGFFLLVNFVNKREIRIKWWQWGLTLLGFVYVVFVLELVVAFLDENVFRGALVMGLLFGFIAVIWGVLMARFVFLRKTPVVENTVMAKEKGD